MFFNLWPLGVESRDFTQTEKERTACKAEQIHKVTTICGQNGPRLSFCVKIVIILWINSALQAVLSFSVWEKSHDSIPNIPKQEDMLSTLVFEPNIVMKQQQKNYCIQIPCNPYKSLSNNVTKTSQTIISLDWTLKTLLRNPKQKAFLKSCEGFWDNTIYPLR